MKLRSIYSYPPEPWSLATVEDQFLLSACLSMERRNKYLRHTADGRMGTDQGRAEMDYDKLKVGCAPPCHPLT